MAKTNTDEKITDQIGDMVQKAVQVKTGRRIDHATAVMIYEACIEMFLTHAVNTRYARLPGGFGSFHLRDVKGSAYRAPVSGELMGPAPDTKILKYVEGLAIRNMLGKLDKHPDRRKPRASSVAALFLHLGELPPVK